MDAIILTIDQMQGFVPKTVIVMFFSMTITFFIIKHGFLDYLGKISRPITYFLKLPEQAAVTTMLAFGSALSANIMLAEFLRERIINEDDAYLGALLNGTSVTIKEIFTYQIPIILPILGFKAGIIYLCCFISSALLKYFYIYFFYRFGKRHEDIQDDYIEKEEKKNHPEVKFKRQMITFIRLISVYILVTFVILTAMNAGLTGYFEMAVKPINKLLGMPLILAVPVSIFIFSPIAGVSAIGSLVTNNSITDIDAALAIVVGSFIMIPIYTLRGNLSRTTSIFGRKLGLKIVTTSMSLTMLSRFLFIIGIQLYKGV